MDQSTLKIELSPDCRQSSTSTDSINQQLYFTPASSAPVPTTPAAPRRATIRPSTLQPIRMEPAKRVLFNQFIRFHLGRDRYLSTSRFNGEDRVHLRKFDGEIPTRCGIALSLRQTKLLLDVVDTVDCTVDKEWASLNDEEKPEHFIHLGFGAYLKVYKFNGERYYDVRRYWKPPQSTEVVPTKTGLHMNRQEFEKLKQVQTSLLSTFPELFDIVPCDCMTQGNQLAALRCPECNPFHHSDW